MILKRLSPLVVAEFLFTQPSSQTIDWRAHSRSTLKQLESSGDLHFHFDSDFTPSNNSNEKLSSFVFGFVLDLDFTPSNNWNLKGDLHLDLDFTPCNKWNGKVIYIFTRMTRFEEKWVKS